PASAASQIVDTLGAGDSFIAGMLVARLAGAPLDAAAARASALAAQSCGTLGAFGYAEPAARMTVASDHRFAS
ncbi:MAG: hypothetical protein KDB60_09210, partial [Propionibacteriaceae bacterium]|nr:hypothetical protein [Propionibacteriaceae bacterium]